MIVNKIAVSNCDALRYACFTHFYKRNKVDIDWDKTYNEAMGLESELPAVFQQPTVSPQYFM